MGVKFFGQFLIERGEIQAGQLRAALDLMKRENLSLGELAVKAGYATGADSRRINAEQRRLDRPYGELALEMGVISAVQLDELLAEQQQIRLGLGQALKSLKFIDVDHLAAMEDEFKLEQDQFSDMKISLPFQLEGKRVAESLVDFLPRYCLRMARLAARVGGYEPLSEPSVAPFIASLLIVGRPGIEMALAADRPFAQKLGSGISGLRAENLSDDRCLDAIGEFLNILAGNAISVVEESGREYRIEAPRFGESPRDGWSFEVASDHGEAAFILAPR
jgi:hypothetical protein